MRRGMSGTGTMAALALGAFVVACGGSNNAPPSPPPSSAGAGDPGAAAAPAADPHAGDPGATPAADPHADHPDFTPHPAACPGDSSPTGSYYMLTQTTAGKLIACIAYASFPAAINRNKARYPCEHATPGTCHEVCSCPTTPAPTGCCEKTNSAGYKSLECNYAMPTALIQPACPTSFSMTPAF